MLLQTFKNTDEAKEPESAPVQRKEYLSTKMPNYSVAQIVQPVVIIGVSRQGMLGPVVV